jgi:uncharacterized protein (TIGR03032 family)
MKDLESIWERQNKAIRHPSEVFGNSYDQAGITNKTLKFEASHGFIRILNKLGITLVVSREYENLLIALRSVNSQKIEQSFFHLPHPSGIVANRRKKLLYVASTRNPNQIIEFKVSKGNMVRQKVKNYSIGNLIPSRSKTYPGQYYFHDLATDGSNIYANSVGLNCILKLDFSSNQIEKPIWWPKCIERSGKPDFTSNYIQLNSIALGRDLDHSYFSASASKISGRRPGQLNFQVDGRGVIISGKTRESEFVGLTRPHSAKLYKGKLWVANSGYGEVGYFNEKDFVNQYKCDGWTRGLCFIEDVLFVGVSRVLPRFKKYAPGINTTNQVCSILAFELKTGKKIGEIIFPYGNQIFAIDYFNSSYCKGFPFLSIKKNGREKEIFSLSF